MQYAEEIRTAYLQCEHSHEGCTTVDWVTLQQQLTKLMKHARVEGLGARDFQELVRAELPEVWQRLEATWFKVAA